MALVIHSKNPSKTKVVKNLGWLLNHRKEVKEFHLYPLQFSGALMNAFLTEDRIYYCEWASRDVLRNWLDRPVFRGLPIFWH